MSTCLCTPRTITWAAQLTAGTATMPTVAKTRAKVAAIQRAGADGSFVGQLCLCTRWKCGGQENMCSMVRRCPRWLRVERATAFLAKLSKLKQAFSLCLYRTHCHTAEALKIINNKAGWEQSQRVNDRMSVLDGQMYESTCRKRSSSVMARFFRRDKAGIRWPESEHFCVLFFNSSKSQ